MDGKFAAEKKLNFIENFKKTDNLLNYILYFALVLMVVVLSIGTDKFLTAPNIISVLRQISMQAIIAVGMTMLIIMGQMDLSVGAVVAFSSVINAILMKHGMPIPVAVIVALAAGSVVGLINGTVTAKYKVHAFLVTLAMTTIVRGFTYLSTGGYPIGGISKSFSVIGQGYVSIIPIPVIIMLVIYIIGWYVLNKTPFGRCVYAVGGNAEAARLSGINIERTKILVFVIASFLSGISGIILSSRLMAGSPETGTGWEMDIIAAVIIGGTNLFGGEGKLSGTLMGMLFIGILTNGMILLDLSPYIQMVVRGCVILAAVILNSFNKN